MGKSKKKNKSKSGIDWEDLTAAPPRDGGGGGGGGEVGGQTGPAAVARISVRGRGADGAGGVHFSGPPLFLSVFARDCCARLAWALLLRSKGRACIP